MSKLWIIITRIFVKSFSSAASIVLNYFTLISFVYKIKRINCIIINSLTNVKETFFHFGKRRKGIEINAFKVILHLFLLIQNILIESVNRKLENENKINLP